MSNELHWRKRFETEGPDYVGKPNQSVFVNVVRRWSVGTVLDFGCGVGRFTGFMQESPRVIPDGVWGWDTNRDAVPHGDRFKSPASAPIMPNMLTWDVFRTVFQPKQFDTIFAITVLQHIPDEELWRWAVELIRVMAPGARLVLVEDANPEGATAGTYMNFRTWRDYRELFAVLQLVDLSVVTAERPSSHYVAVYR